MNPSTLSRLPSLPQGEASTGAKTAPKADLDPQMTVAAIMRRFPEARAVFAKYGIDACCGGVHPLDFACRAHKLSVEEVLDALRRAGRDKVAVAPASVAIDLKTNIRAIIRSHPATAAVLDRHGLMGCGGSGGPNEPLGWFAKVHQVDPEALIKELNEVVGAGVVPSGQPAPGVVEDPRAEGLYQRFLKAALLFTFTGGAMLGAWALVLMAVRGQLGGLGRGLIQVHGHYQLFGWVGLFVVGIAYHILPRLTGVALPSYRQAALSFSLLMTGTVLRVAQSLDPSLLRTTLLTGGAMLELGGATLFLLAVTHILRRQPGRAAPWQIWVALGTGWFLAAAVLNLVHALYLSARNEFEVPPDLNVPYLTLFLLGFVTFWVLGVSMRTLPLFMGLKTRPGLLASLPLLLVASVSALAVGESLTLSGVKPAGPAAMGLGGLLTAILLALFVYGLGILRRGSSDGEPGIDRGYEKFLRLGYAWLLISGVMLAVFSIRALAGAEMNHSLVGAYRHALTVGFITTVMVGMASRIVPVFRGVPLYSTWMREASFWLIAAGNVIRVVFQALSGLYGSVWLRVAGVSGVLELAGLLLFGVNIWKTMNSSQEGNAATASTPLPAIARDTSAADLLRAYPSLLPVFLNAGFTQLANPFLRRTLARGVTIGQACRRRGVDVERFLNDLSEAKPRITD